MAGFTLREITEQNHRSRKTRKCPCVPNSKMTIDDLIDRMNELPASDVVQFANIVARKFIRVTGVEKEELLQRLTHTIKSALPADTREVERAYKLKATVVILLARILQKKPIRNVIQGTYRDVVNCLVDAADTAQERHANDVNCFRLYDIAAWGLRTVFLRPGRDQLLSAFPLPATV
jgi:hypothetical protein